MNIEQIEDLLLTVVSRTMILETQMISLKAVLYKSLSKERGSTFSSQLKNEIDSAFDKMLPNLQLTYSLVDDAAQLQIESLLKDALKRK